jgi:hypothetical protein
LHDGHSPRPSQEEPTRKSCLHEAHLARARATDGRAPRPVRRRRNLPGSRFPVVPEGRLRETRPDAIVVLPWKLNAKIKTQLAYTRDWDARFITAIPHLSID